MKRIKISRSTAFIALVFFSISLMTSCSYTEEDDIPSDKTNGAHLAFCYYRLWLNKTTDALYDAKLLIEEQGSWDDIKIGGKLSARTSFDDSFADTLIITKTSDNGIDIEFASNPNYMPMVQKISVEDAGKDTWVVKSLYFNRDEKEYREIAAARDAYYIVPDAYDGFSGTASGMKIRWTTDEHGITKGYLSGDVHMESIANREGKLSIDASVPESDPIEFHYRMALADDEYHYRRNGYEYEDLTSWYEGVVNMQVTDIPMNKTDKILVKIGVGIYNVQITIGNVTESWKYYSNY